MARDRADRQRHVARPRSSRPATPPTPVAFKRINISPSTPSAAKRYTRNGEIKMGLDGTLPRRGQPLMREDGKTIQISPRTAPVIRADGAVCRRAGGGAPQDRRADTGVQLVHERATASSPRARGGSKPSGSPRWRDGRHRRIECLRRRIHDGHGKTPRTFEAFQKMLDTFSECDRKVPNHDPHVQRLIMGVRSDRRRRRRAVQVEGQKTVVRARGPSQRDREGLREPDRQEAEPERPRHADRAGLARDRQRLDAYNYNFGGIRAARRARTRRRSSRTKEVYDGKEVEVRDGFQRVSVPRRGRRRLRPPPREVRRAIERAGRATSTASHALKQAHYYTADESK